MSAGDEAVAQDDYYSAYRFYRVALEYPGKESNPEALYKLGTTAVKSRAFQVGRDALLRLQTLPEASTYPDRSYYLAESYYRTGDYDQAVILYQTFLDDNPDGAAWMRSSATTNIKDANWAINADRYERDITLTHLPANVNSEYSDVAFSISPGGTEYFTSNRFKFKKDTLNPRRKLSKVLRREEANVGVPLPKNINLPGKLVAHSSFNTTGNQVYYSVCEYYDYENIRCNIYRADVNGKGEWINPQMLDGINGEGYTSQMPNVGSDGVTGMEYLYFSSNQDGGLGKLDIYRAAIAADGTLGVATNLTEVNTEGNDVSPFFYSPQNTLYFSTDGRESFGGLDVYKSLMINGEYLTPVNLGSPVNSSYDDAYYARYENRETAYVSSTRQSPQALFFDEEKEVCCYDIYQFPPDDRIDLLATTYNKVNNEDLLGASLTLYEVGPNGLIEIETIENIEGNDFAFKLEPGKKYELHAMKDGFSSVIDAFDLNDPEFKGAGIIERKLYLAPKVDLEVLTFNSNDGQPLEGATVQLFRIDENGNETLVQELTNATANDFTFPLEYGNLYVIKGTRPGFAMETDQIDLRNVTPDGTSVIKRRLDFGQLLEILVIDGITKEPLLNSTVTLARVGGPEIAKKTNSNGHDFQFTINLNRAFTTFTEHEGYYSSIDTLNFSQADLDAGNGKLQYIIPLYPANIDKLLPLSVYFDNDHPNPRSTSRNTNLNYSETYQPYYGRKTTFADEFTQGMEDEDEEYDTRVRFTNFFNRRVKGGWDQLEAFAQQLEIYLASGNSIELKIQGFASPRAASDYNLRLSWRRIESVVNYFEAYNNGVLKNYIRSGDLTFDKDAKGEVADPNDVSDRLDDPRQSVFSLIASLERRVEVSNNSKQ